MPAWVFDAQDESTPLDTTGGHTWPAARRLADFLSACACELGLSAPGVRLLELGAGTGWLGVTVARNLPAAALVCLTEQARGLEHLGRNVELNRQRGLPLGHVRVAACDWREHAEGRQATAISDSSSKGGGKLLAAAGAGDAECREGQQQQSGLGNRMQQPEGQEQPRQRRSDRQQVGGCSGCSDGSGSNAGLQDAEFDILHTAWDYIVGSDLVYNEVGSRCLPRVMAALAGSSTRILYCHTRHRYDLLDAEFFAELEAGGLCCEEVWEPGREPPEPSSPMVPQFPPATLFPEQRRAVYLITRADAAA